MKRCGTPVVYKAPRSAQKTIPVEEIYEDGMMKHRHVYSVCFQLADANYVATSEEHQAGILLGFEEIIKSVASDVNMKIVLMNRLVDQEKLSQSISVAMQGDKDDDLRRELNSMNAARALEGENNIVRERYLVLSGERSSRQEAQAWFKRIKENLFRDVSSLGTAAQQMNADERLEVLARFFRPESEYVPAATQKRQMISGRHCASHFSNSIAPDAMEFPLEGSWFRVGGRYGRALMIRSFPTNMDDTLLADLMNMPREMLIAADHVTMSKEDALKIVHRHKDTVEGDVRKRTMTARKEGNWNATVPRHLAEQRDNCEYIFDILNREDQRLVMTQVVIVHMAPTKDQLDFDTESIRATARGKGCDIGILRHRQEKGLNTALPYGLEMVGQRKIISSENASFMVPFRTKEIFEPQGIIYGVNEISRNIVMMNRMAYKNGNGFIVGDAGGGKSILAKSEMYAVFLTTQDDMVILDPDGEYARIVEWLGGQVVHISADSKDHINLMDISRDFDAGDDAITLKCSVISGAADLMMRGSMSGAQRSILDRCVYRVLAGYQNHPGASVPTLATLYDELRSQPEAAAADIAMAMEIYARGSLNTFAQKTNVDISNRIVCFDIKDLSPQMRDLGMMVVLDEIDRRVARNRAAGRHTWVWCDEIWTLLNYPATEEFLWGFWKRCRKYGGLPTGITQSLTAVKDSEKGREMLSNSEFVFMMGMSADDREGAAELFSLSEDQRGYLTRAAPGHGLLRAGKTVIPLDATIDRNSSLYKVATTKLEEVAELKHGLKTKKGPASAGKLRRAGSKGSDYPVHF